MLFPCLAATLGRLRELAGSLGRSWLHGQVGARRLSTQHAKTRERVKQGTWKHLGARMPP